jgi:hypothetical protein
MTFAASLQYGILPVMPDDLLLKRLEDLEGDTQKIVELLQILVTATQRGHWRSREVEHAKKFLGELVKDHKVSPSP